MLVNDGGWERINASVIGEGWREEWRFRCSNYAPNDSLIIP